MTEAILYSTSNYLATSTVVSDDPLTVVIFDYWTEHPSLDTEPPGASFFRQQGINVIGIKTARNDWYQGREMVQLCRAVVAATPGARRVGYGGSMGGYAVINFADDLDLAAVIAICPQVSIDPVQAPFERRWRSEAEAITFHCDKIARPERERRARGYLVFDPHTVDQLHAERILQHHDLVPVRIRHGGHDQMLMLQQCGMLAGMLIDMVYDRFCLASCLAMVRRRRRRSWVYWLNLARILSERGRYRASEAALLQARRFPDCGSQSFRWQFHAAFTDILLAASASHGAPMDRMMFGPVHGFR